MKVLRQQLNIRFSILFVSSIGLLLHLEVSGQENRPIGFDLMFNDRLDEEYREYNFWNGHWNATWKTWLKKDEYAFNGNAKHRVFSTLDGKVLVELVHSPVNGGSETAGFSIRYFDDDLDKWVMLQSWPGIDLPNISSLQGTHHLGRIQVYQNWQSRTETFGKPAGTTVFNRYTFSDAQSNSFRWDNAFSVDSMKTWFTRDVAEFIRDTESEERLPSGEGLFDDDLNWFSYGTGYNCHENLLSQLRPYLGEWRGNIEYMSETDKSEYDVIRVLLPGLSNCAALGYQLTFLENETLKEFLFVTYLPSLGQWVYYTIDNIKGKSHETYFSDSLKEVSMFKKKDLFGVPGSGTLEEFQWGFAKRGQQIIKGELQEAGGRSFTITLIKDE